MSISVVAVSRSSPASVEIRGKQVNTSIVRERSIAPLRLEADGIDGNLTAVHTEQVLGFSRHQYDYWCDRFGLAQGSWPDAFWGENIVFDRLDEADLRIGTRLRVGADAELQVTSPRNPCFKLSWRLEQPDSVLDEILESGRTGFYMRVVHAGVVFDGDPVQLIGATPAAPTVADVARMLSKRSLVSQQQLQEALASEGLGAQCAGMLRQRLTELVDVARTKSGRWQGWRPFAVAAIADDASRVRSFELMACDGMPLVAYRAGQHVQVRLDGLDSRAHTRAWSLSDYEDRPGRYRLSIKRSGRGAASDRMHGVAVGEIVNLRAPSGSFYLDRTSNHPSVLISAGIGVTPLLAMLKAYALLGPNAPPVQWIHVGRNGREQALASEVQALLRGMPNAHRHVRFTAPLATDRLGMDYDASGRMTLEALREVIRRYRYSIFGREVELPGAASEFYLCGPLSFETDMRAMLTSLGAAATSIRSESFGARDIEAEPTNVYFERSGIHVIWQPGSTLLETAEDAGIAVESDCRSGSCQQCVTTLLAGAVTYDRAPLVPPPDGAALLCCSRPAGALLTLDL